MGYKIARDEAKEKVWVYGDNQTFTDEDKAKLWKDEKIFYNGGIFAIMVQERKMNDPLCILGHEDDGCIYFDKKDSHFAAYWLNDLINTASGVIVNYMRGE